jgi:hypothetical protein
MFELVECMAYHPNHKNRRLTSKRLPRSQRLELSLIVLLIIFQVVVQRGK